VRKASIVFLLVGDPGLNFNSISARMHRLVSPAEQAEVQVLHPEAGMALSNLELTSLVLELPFICIVAG
jgi:hypothetical protein